MARRSFRRIPTQSCSVNLEEEENLIELKEEEVGEVPIQPTSSPRTSKRNRTSLVWQAYTIVVIIEDGKDVQKGQCNYYGKMYNAESARGIGHLIRHRKKCEPLHKLMTGGARGVKEIDPNFYYWW